MIDNREQAARWFAVLRRGVMTVDERAAYDAWRQDGANAAAMAELKGIWNGLEAVRGRVSANDRTVPAFAQRRHSRFGRSVRVAAVVGAMFMGVGIMYNTDNNQWTTLDWSDR